MNQLIKDMFDLWGLDASETKVYSAIVLFASLLGLSLVFVLLSKIAFPKASSTRTFVLKAFVIFAMIAVLLSVYVDLGANVIISGNDSGDAGNITIKEGYAIITLESGYTLQGTQLSPGNSHTFESDGILFTGTGVYEGEGSDTLNGNYISVSSRSIIFVKSGDVFVCESSPVFYVPLPIAHITDAIIITE